MKTFIQLQTNNLMSRWTGHIPVYHATYHDIPKQLCGKFHNVQPHEFERQIDWLAHHFELLPLDEWMARKDRQGTASITFDDAYTSIFKHAIPLLLERGIPCTIFVCGCTLDGSVFWRDKVRIVTASNLLDEFLEHYRSQNKTDHGMTAENFHAKSKSREVNSRLVAQALDDFGKEKNLSFDQSRNCVYDPSMLLKHPLVTYGNHSYHHYQLSSLPPKKQHDEIARNEKLLSELGHSVSRTFAVPFGALDSVNESTISILNQLGYQAILFTLNKIQLGKAKFDHFGLPASYRYLPKPNWKDFQAQLAQLHFKTLKHMPRHPSRSRLKT